MNSKHAERKKQVLHLSCIDYSAHIKFTMCTGLLLEGKSHTRALVTFVSTFMSKQLLVAQS